MANIVRDVFPDRQQRWCHTTDTGAVRLLSNFPEMTNRYSDPSRKCRRSERHPQLQSHVDDTVQNSGLGLHKEGVSCVFCCPPFFSLGPDDRGRCERSQSHLGCICFSVKRSRKWRFPPRTGHPNRCVLGDRMGRYPVAENLLIIGSSILLSLVHRVRSGWLVSLVHCCLGKRSGKLEDNCLMGFRERHP